MALVVQKPILRVDQILIAEGLADWLRSKTTRSDGVTVDVICRSASLVPLRMSPRKERRPCGEAAIPLVGCSVFCSSLFFWLLPPSLILYMFVLLASKQPALVFVYVEHLKPQRLVGLASWELYRSNAR